MTSSRPYLRTTCSYIASTCDSSTRSARTTCSPTECSALSTPATTPPSLANLLATAWPISLAAPLTTQTLPASRDTGTSRTIEYRAQPSPHPLPGSRRMPRRGGRVRLVSVIYRGRRYPGCRADRSLGVLGGEVAIDRCCCSEPGGGGGDDLGGEVREVAGPPHPG